MIFKLPLVVMALFTLPTGHVHLGHTTVEASKVFIMVIGQRYLEDVIHIQYEGIVDESIPHR